jgi:TPR repeat protein
MRTTWKLLLIFLSMVVLDATWPLSADAARSSRSQAAPGAAQNRQSSGDARNAGAGPTVSAPLREAAAAYDAKDFAKAKKILKPLADKGDDNAAFGMGLMAARGEGGKQNLKDAEQWWKKSSAAGNPQAQYNLGYLYFRGALGTQDFVKAREQWSKAAVQQHPDALYGLGILQVNGAGGPKDLKAGIRNFEQAASFGHPLAEFELGQAYLEGSGVKKDRKKAREYFKKAADQGIQEAKSAFNDLEAKR